VRREVRAEAAAREQVIAARAQEEAMKHVLPFKQRQIEQRRLEAEAEKESRMKIAEGNAQARRIEASGEADARRKLAEAEAFRMEKVGQAGAEQMAREGTLLTRHPLLIQKTLADKLSDKVQVIIRAPGFRRRVPGGQFARRRAGRASCRGAAGGGPARRAGLSMLASALITAAAAATFGSAIVATDQAVLRASPRGSAPAQAQLWQGELLEVRGERQDYLQVWDPVRERGGYVKANQVRRSTLAPEEAPQLLAVLGFVREAPGAESLGIGIAAAYLQAAPAQSLRGPAGAEALDALGTLAERLAQRASAAPPASKAGQAALSAHLEVASHHGVRFTSYEQAGRMRICYDGDAFRRVLALPAQPLQQARAALALTQPECIDPALQPLQRHQRNLWRADVLERVEMAALPPYVRNRVALRRAAVWSALAYEHTRLGEPAQAAAERALAEFASVGKSNSPRTTSPRTTTRPCASTHRAGPPCPSKTQCPIRAVPPSSPSRDNRARPASC
jgi:hypothetical protein